MSMAMELPDEAVTYQYQGLLVPAGEDWTPAAELRAQHFVAPARLKELIPRLTQVRGQVAADREMRNVPNELLPLDAGFINLPQDMLDQFRRKGDVSELGKVLTLANRLKDEADHLVLLGTGGSYLAARALFEALKGTYHNELPAAARLGVPRLYFEGNNFDNDSLQELLELIQITCVEPKKREERWGVVCISKSGTTLEPAVALRVFRRDATEYYGLRSPWLTRLFAAVTGPNTRLRELFKAQGHEDDVLTIPDNVGGRFSLLTPAGLLPAALMGLDARALLQGAAAMTKRFLEEPFERNPVLQFAGMNYLLTQELNKPVRVLSVWSRKLEGLGRWYDHLLAESLGKHSRGPTPLTTVQTRDLHARGQHHQEGPRDRVINNLIVKNARSVPILVAMADRNEDDLNAFNRKGLPDLLAAALHVTNQALFDAARPSADLVLPTLSEHTLGQLMQMLMLATVIEGRLVGINPYSQPALEAMKQQLRDHLKAAPPGSRPGAEAASTTPA
jgi:glucose-6-phosphate isomerase